MDPKSIFQRCFHGRRRCRIVWSFLDCLADVIQPRLVTSPKQRQEPCSGPPKDSSSYRKCVLNSSFKLIGKSTIYHLHICHIAPQIFTTFCFLFLLAISVVPRESKSNAYAKFWLAYKVYFERCTNGEWLFWQAIRGAYSTPGGQVRPRTKISASLADGLDQSLGLVSSVEQDDRQWTTS